MLNRQGKLLIFFFLIAGICLRFLWPADMEWKADEKLMYSLAETAVHSNQLPQLGMPSGGGVVNAGFSIWPFVLFYHLSSSPLGMVFWVMLLNVLALLLLYFCIKKYEENEQQWMMTGLASFAVSLMPVLFSRKLWAQDILLCFTAVIWYCYLHRKWLPSLVVLGLAFALAGQVHLSGFFYFAGFCLAMLWYQKFRFTQWIAIGAGFSAGMLPAIVWIQEFLKNPSGSSNMANILKAEFWLHALIDPLGINAYYSLGKDTKTFAAFELGNVSTCLPAVLVLTIVVVFLAGMFRFFKSGLSFRLKKAGVEAYAFVLFPGLLLTFSGQPVRSHYLIPALPFLAMGLFWLMHKLAYKWRMLMVFAQMGISVLFLVFVHQKQEINGDFGTTYRNEMTREKR